MLESGLVLVTTPIGNPDDLTPRARKYLEKASVIAAEDTRVFGQLKALCGLQNSEAKLVSFHDHSNDSQVAKLLEFARSGLLCVVSDAGSPVISDPAHGLVLAARQAGIAVSAASGISAATAALELSGLPATPFHFHGFLPRKSGEQESFFAAIKSQKGTHIFFESPKRVKATLALGLEVFSEFVAIKEISKSFESVYTVTSETLEQIDERGEFVVLVHSAGSTDVMSSEIQSMSEELLKKGARPKAVCKLVAKILNKNSREVYDALYGESPDRQ